MTKKSIKPMFVFVHIEKTAGTTLDYLMINNMFFYFGLQTWSIWSNDEDTIFTQDKFRSLKKILPFIRGVGGHSIRSFLRYENVEPVRYVTFLRNPIDRYISHYKHQKYKMGLNWTIEDYLKESRFDNNITNKLSPTGDLQDAIDNLHKFDFVGIQEQFDTSILAMKQTLELDDFNTDYEVKNVGINNDSVDLLEKHILVEIEKRNKKDIELYRHALKIHDSYKAKYAGNLEDDLFILKVKNQKYKENKLKIICHKIIKLFLIKPVEYLIENSRI